MRLIPHLARKSIDHRRHRQASRGKWSAGADPAAVHCLSGGWSRRNRCGGCTRRDANHPDHARGLDQGVFGRAKKGATPFFHPSRPFLSAAVNGWSGARLREKSVRLEQHTPATRQPGRLCQRGELGSGGRGLHRQTRLEFRRLQDRQIGRMLIQHSWNEDTPLMRGSSPPLATNHDANTDSIRDAATRVRHKRVLYFASASCFRVKV